jgi:hypothetical protein
MSVNRDRPHVFVLPEDDANRQLANGFHLELDLIRQMQVLLPAGGWIEVLRRFLADHVAEMDRNQHRYMVLLIDFDGKNDRVDEAKAKIPNRLIDRVFVLGVRTDPETLRADLGYSYEQIGRDMAEDCREETDTIWGHDLLRHNSGEIARLRQHVRPILF